MRPEKKPSVEANLMAQPESQARRKVSTKDTNIKTPFPVAGRIVQGYRESCSNGVTNPRRYPIQIRYPMTRHQLSSLSLPTKLGRNHVQHIILYTQRPARLLRGFYQQKPTLLCGISFQRPLGVTSLACCQARLLKQVQLLPKRSVFEMF